MKVVEGRAPSPSRWSSPGSTKARTCRRNMSMGCARSASRGSPARNVPIARSRAWPISPSAIWPTVPAIAVAGCRRLTASPASCPNTRPRSCSRPLGIAFPRSKFAATRRRSRRRCRRDRLSGGAQGAGRRAGPQERCRRGDPQPQDGRRSARRIRPHVSSNVAAYDAAISLDGVLVEKMGKMGVEMIVGRQVAIPNGARWCWPASAA